MSALEIQIPLFEQSDRSARRRESRETLVRRVEYCRFPRVCADQRLRVGFTRDVSGGGLCLRSDDPEPVGSLLRLALHALDGRAEPERLARVAWTSRGDDGGHLLGLELLEARASRPVRIHYVRSRALSVA